MIRAKLLLSCLSLIIMAPPQEKPRQAPAIPEGISRSDVGCYKDCLTISNQVAKVVTCERGGRILVYQRDDKNILFLRDESNWDPNGKGLAKQLSGGRFDIGPEQIQSRGDLLWNGDWNATATAPRQITMTSQVDPDSGLQVVRVFQLDESTSQLTITQNVTNKGRDTVRQCYWSRTLAVHGGVAIVPCDATRSLMPNLYCMAPNGKTLNVRPEDPAVRHVDDFLVIDGPPEFAKLGMDSVKGWVAYQSPHDQLLLKKYPVFDVGQYGDLAGYNLSIWYPNKDRLAACEVEPIGPTKTLQPGESDSFTVQWWLLSRKFPKSGTVDPHAVEKFVAPMLK